MSRRRLEACVCYLTMYVLRSSHTVVAFMNLRGQKLRVLSCTVSRIKNVTQFTDLTERGKTKWGGGGGWREMWWSPVKFQRGFQQVLKFYVDKRDAWKGILTGTLDTVTTVTKMVSVPMPASFVLTASLHWFHVTNCTTVEARQVACQMTEI
jgi:hypothetical protein